MRVLFLCSQNKFRSPTAEQVFAKRPGLETDSAGLNNDAAVHLSPEQLEWADLVVCMDRPHLNKLRKRFGRHLKGKRVVCLAIPDEYEYMQPELITLIEQRMAGVLRRIAATSDGGDAAT